MIEIFLKFGRAHFVRGSHGIVSTTSSVTQSWIRIMRPEDSSTPTLVGFWRTIRNYMPSRASLPIWRMWKRILWWCGRTGRCSETEMIIANYLGKNWVWNVKQLHFRHYNLVLMLSILIPPFIPWLFFNEEFTAAWYATVCGRIAIAQNITLTVNSVRLQTLWQVSAVNQKIRTKLNFIQNSVSQ